jgi:sulfate transport system ATP-binding protein
VLLLDEPFGALDAKVRQGLRRWLRRLHDEIHVTSILVTHDQEEALEVADRVVVMNDGRIEQMGTPDEVYHHPTSEFVMDFLGNVNLFHGRAEEGADAGKPARLLVRPYDVELHRDRNGSVRILSAGAQVKLELETDTGNLVQVDMPHQRYREMGILLDQQLSCTPRDAKLFVEEGAVGN